MWPFWYLDAKMIDFRDSLQTRGSEENGQNASRAGRNLDILASWHQLGHQLGCLAALLVFLGTKISIFWWLWQHENIAFV